MSLPNQTRCPIQIHFPSSPNRLAVSNLTPRPFAGILEDTEGLTGCLQVWACGWVLEDNPRCNHHSPSPHSHGTKDETKIGVLSSLGANPGSPPDLHPSPGDTNTSTGGGEEPHHLYEVVRQNLT